MSSNRQSRKEANQRKKKEKNIVRINSVGDVVQQRNPMQLVDVPIYQPISDFAQSNLSFMGLQSWFNQPTIAPLVTPANQVSPSPQENHQTSLQPQSNISIAVPSPTQVNNPQGYLPSNLKYASKANARKIQEQKNLRNQVAVNCERSGKTVNSANLALRSQTVPSIKPIQPPAQIIQENYPNLNFQFNRQGQNKKISNSPRKYFKGNEQESQRNAPATSIPTSQTQIVQTNQVALHFNLSQNSNNINTISNPRQNTHPFFTQPQPPSFGAIPDPPETSPSPNPQQFTANPTPLMPPNQSQQQTTSNDLIQTATFGPVISNFQLPPQHICSPNMNQTILIQYLQNQLSLINASLVNRLFFGSNGNNNRPPCHIPANQTKWFQHLNINFSVYQDAGLIKPYYKYQVSKKQSNSQINLIPTSIDYLLLFKYLVHEEISIRKTKNIYLLIDLLKQASQKKITRKFSSSAQVKDHYEYFPYLFSMKKWQEGILANLKILKEQIQQFRLRRVQRVQEKVIKLKKIASEIQMVDVFLKPVVKTFKLVQGQVKSTIQLFLAFNQNNRLYQYVYPDDGIVQICKIIHSNYQSMLENISDHRLIKANQMVDGVQEPITSTDVMKLLIERILLLSSDFKAIQTIFTKIKARRLTKSEAQMNESIPQSANDWKMIQLFRQIDSILRRTKRLEANQ